MIVRRREFIRLVAGGAAWPIATHAQQPSVPVIGILHSATPDSYAPMMAAFSKGLNEVGFVEGQNVAFEYRWAENQYDRLHALAADLVRRQVAVVFTGGASRASLAAKALTSTIPIVFANGADAIAVGLVASLNRPGGNVTGISFLIGTLGQKHLEVLRELVPSAAVIAVLINPKVQTADAQFQDLQAATRAFGLKAHAVRASTDSDLDQVFPSLRQLRADGLVILADAFLNSRRNHLVGLAARHSIPTIYPWREAVAAGGLASYGTDIADAYRHAGVYTGRILKGEKPAELPVQQSVKVQLAINLKTATTLRLTVPVTLLARADEVIE